MSKQLNKRILHQPLRGLDGFFARSSLQNRRKCERYAQRKLMNKILILSLLTILSGCATSIVQYKDSKPVPKEDRGPAFQKYSEKKENTGTVIVVRDTGALGAAGETDFFINGELIAGIYTKESVTLHLTPGEYLLGVGPGVSSSLEETKKYMEEQALMVQSGKTYYYRISIVMGKGLILQRTSLIN